MKGLHWCADIVFLEEDPTLAGVFRNNEVSFAKGADSAKSDVL